MRRVKLFVIIAIVLIFMFTVISYASQEGSKMYQAGQLLMQFWDNPTPVDSTEDHSDIAAIFRDHVIMKSTVEYRFRMHQLLNEENDQTLDYYDIVNGIVEGMVIVEEAQRLGVGAAPAEIEDMVNRAISNYNNPDFPEIKEELDAYCQGAGISIDDYYSLIAEVAPSAISKQKLRDEIGRQYCKEHGLEFTKVNPPQEMLDAIDAYIEELFEACMDEIIYYIDN